jgi:hypothetical protein
MKKFAKDLAERAVGTFAATAVGLIVVVGAVGIEGVDWKTVASVSALATVVTVLKSLAAKFRGNEDSASLSKDV